MRNEELRNQCQHGTPDCDDAGGGGEARARYVCDMYDVTVNEAMKNQN